MAAARLQRWAVLLASYNYTIQYPTSADNSSADAMSRLPLLQEVNDPLNQFCPRLVCWERYLYDPLLTDELLFYTPVDAALPVTSQQLGTATQHHPQLAQVHHWIRTGWPATVPDKCKPYANRGQELSTDGNCLPTCESRYS